MKKDRIIIVRHGKPALARDKSMDWRGYRLWWQKYDEGGLADIQKIPPRVKELAGEADIVISSTLRRAKETAVLCRDGQPADLFDEDLVEAHLPPPHWGALKFKPRAWGVWSRISWWLGASDDMESRADANIRCERMATKLEGHAAGGKTVFVTAHGWYNRMLSGALQRRGWKKIESTGDRHWSRRVLVRPTKENEND